MQLHRSEEERAHSPSNLQWLFTLESLLICSEIPKGRRSQASVGFLDSYVQHRPAEKEAANRYVSNPSHTKNLRQKAAGSFLRSPKHTRTHIFDGLPKKTSFLQKWGLRDCGSQTCKYQPSHPPIQFCNLWMITMKLDKDNRDQHISKSFRNGVKPCKCFHQGKA